MIERLCMTEEKMIDTCDASDGFLQKLPDVRVLS